MSAPSVAHRPASAIVGSRFFRARSRSCGASSEMAGSSQIRIAASRSLRISELPGIVEVNVAELEPEALCSVGGGSLIDRENARVPQESPEHRDARQGRIELAEHLQSLAHDLRRVALHPR